MFLLYIFYNKKMIEMNIFPDIRTYNNLIMMYGKQGNIEYMTKFFKNIENSVK